VKNGGEEQRKRLKLKERKFRRREKQMVGRRNKP